MESKVILPFVVEPLSKQYQYTAFPLGIIQANMEKEKFSFWLATKYIHCSFDLDERFHKFNLENDPWFHMERILIKHNNSFSKIIKEFYNIDILKTFKEMLSKGYYIYGFYNEEHIPQKSAYKKERYLCDFILYGYDDEKQVFKSIGYLANKNYEPFEISYENMYQAVETLFDGNVGFDVVEYNSRKVRVIEFNINDIINGITEYLNGQTINNRKFTGIRAIHNLLSYMETNNTIDVRYTRGIMEHKYFMKNRVEYLFEQKLIANEDILNVARMVYEKVNTAFLLSVKYSVTKNENDFKKIISMMRETISVEKAYLPVLLQEMKNQIG